MAKRRRKKRTSTPIQSNISDERRTNMDNEITTPNNEILDMEPEVEEFPDGKRVCPIISTSAQFIDCAKKMCQWWVEDIGCAVRILAERF